MEKFQDSKTWYLEQFAAFEKGLNGHSKMPVHALRKIAAQKFTELSFPTLKDEEWKYTDLSALLQRRFTSGQSAVASVSKDQIRKFVFPESGHTLLVFVNGVFVPSLSDSNEENDKIVLRSLSEVFKNDDELVSAYLGKGIEQGGSIFSALNTAFLQDGACILIRKNQVLQKPVHILYLNAAQSEQAIQPRNLIVLEENAQASIIESFESISSNSVFTNAVSEVFLGPNAQLSQVKIQNENKDSFHIAYAEAVLQKGSAYTYHTVDLGGRIGRSNFNVRFAGSDAECHLNGLYLAKENQLLDNHTLIDHAVPRCTSNELYKGVLSGKSRAVFNGKVLVRNDAQQTNAFQSNKNILLSDTAIVDTKPQLEIFADDVKCSHGATIGQLDAESLFYLRSRGLSREQARNTLIYAFAKNVMETLKQKEILSYIEDKIHEQLG